MERWKQILASIRERNPQPDTKRLLQAIRRQGEPDRVPLFELYADPEVVTAVVSELQDTSEGESPTEQAYSDLILFNKTLGYDYVQAFLGGFDVLLDRPTLEDTAELSRGERSWAAEGKAQIGTMAEFEAFPWPDPSSFNTQEIEWYMNHVPDGMGVIPGSAGIFEWVTWLMGYETMSIAIYEDEPLIDAMFQRVGELFIAGMEKLLTVPGLTAIMTGDDMGFKTQPMVSPKVLIEKSFPWHKKRAEMAHDAGIPYLMHACGNLESVMDSLIDYVRIDAKHSYEDGIMPVAQFKQRYGDRLAILGGADVDYLCRHSEDEVRTYVRAILDACAPGGGYALGTGNSVANYIPLANYLAMLDEGLAWQA